MNQEKKKRIVTLETFIIKREVEMKVHLNTDIKSV